MLKIITLKNKNIFIIYNLGNILKVDRRKSNSMEGKFYLH